MLVFVILDSGIFFGCTLKRYGILWGGIKDGKELVKVGRVATEIDKSSKAWSQDQKANMLKDVISKLGEK